MTHSSSSIRISLAGLLFCVAITTGPSLAAAAEPPGKAEVNPAANWKMHVVRRLGGGAAAEVRIPAKLQIVTESWNRVVAVPYIVYMPEKDRLLILVGCDYPHVAMLFASEDRGATWSKPWYLHVDRQGKPDTGLCTGLTYLANGRVMATMGALRWSSEDYGKTWSSVPVKGKTLYAWDPPLVEKDPVTGNVTRVVETGYTYRSNYPNSQGYIRFSADQGRNWTEALKVPQWQGDNRSRPGEE